MRSKDPPRNTRQSPVAGMVHIKGLTQLSNLYVSETEVTAKGLALVPTRKDCMVMMSAGKATLSAKQLDEVMKMYPSQIFDPSGYWKPERIKAAMIELGKGVK